MQRPVSPVWLVLASIASVQLGATVAKALFDEVSPTTMVWLRLATSSVVLLVLARPRLAGRTRADVAVVVAFGISLATMNWAIYQSFARMPLGLAVTIEFLGPLTVALVTSRRGRDAAWVLLAAVGVAMLGFQPSGVTLSGVLFALLAAASWGAYIPLSAATGRAWPGLSGLSVASTVGAVLVGVYVVPVSSGELADVSIVAIGAVVGLLSSVLPYSLELVALRTMRPTAFGTLMSLEPAAAALAALVILGERLDPAQWAAVACVVVASAGVTRRSAEPVAPG